MSNYYDTLSYFQGIETRVPNETIIVEAGANIALKVRDNQGHAYVYITPQQAAQTAQALFQAALANAGVGFAPLNPSMPNQIEYEEYLTLMEGVEY